MPFVAEKVPFGDICSLCEKISLKQNRKDKLKLLDRFIYYWRDYHKKLHINDQDTEDSFHSAMRLLLPHLDRERPAYGIKETTLAKLYIDILALSKDSTDAQKLLNYRNPKNVRSEVGDFANVAYMVLRYRCPDKGSLTLADVNKHLDLIASYNVEKLKDNMKKSLCYLLRNSSAEEQKWLIRMILKEMKYGLSEATVLSAYHPDAKDLFDVSSSLSKVCLRLFDPSIRLHEIEISLFDPFRPMLAERVSAKEIEKLMDKSKFYVETKFDGERIQLHKDGNTYKYFSRGSHEYTENFGGLPKTGTITQFINECFKKEVRKCILDGEMVGYNKELNSIMFKSDNIDVKNLRLEDNTYQPCFVVFDILMYNDQILSNYPLSERLKLLETVFEPEEGRMTLSSHTIVSSKDEVMKCLNEAIDRQEEGILIKSSSSVYKPNARRGGWYKVKPEYIENLVDDLDLVILGGYFGEGHRSGVISHFLLGVACSESFQDEKPTMFHSFTKVGSGYSRSELDELLSKLKDHWNIYDKKKPPDCFMLAPGHKEKPDLWIDPSKSYLVQVKASEVMKSERFKTECTLRFPRVIEVRYDKPWFDCMTTQELEKLKLEGEGKLAKRHFEDTGVDISLKKRRFKEEISVASQFKGADLSHIKVLTKIFADKELCIISGPASHPKKTLEKLVVENGGSIVQNPSSNTFCVVSDKENIRIKSLIKAKKHDVVKTSWLIKCLETKQLDDWTKFDLWGCSEDTEKRMKDICDRYGDHYTKHVTVDELKAIFNAIPENDWKSSEVDNNLILEFEFEYFSSIPTWSLFRNCTAYLDTQHGNFPQELKFTELLLRLHGASITSKFNEQTTHVISSPLSRQKHIFLDMNKERRKKFHMVTLNWVKDCVKSKKLLPERGYSVTSCAEVLK